MKHLKNLVNITKTEDEERRFIKITSKLTLIDLTLDQLDKDLEQVINPRNSIAHPFEPTINIPQTITEILNKKAYQNSLCNVKKSAIENIKKTWSRNKKPFWGVEQLNF
ncbi:unnamed protein product [Tenebrio molitor]|jgi:hypothetical protein|nr:unnamed protein product [Tenebrio molitor]